MRTYYQDDQIWVTSTVIRVDRQEYQLAALEGTWIRGGSVALRGVAVGLGVVALAGLYRAGSSYAWWFGGLGRQAKRLATGGPVPLALLAAGALLVALLGVVALEAVLLGVEHVRGHGRHRELWARVDGTDVLLLRTSDAGRFGRICRALTRALADQR